MQAEAFMKQRPEPEAKAEVGQRRLDAQAQRSEDVHLRLRHRHRVHMHMLGLVFLRARVDAHDPLVLDDVLDERARLGVGLEHPTDDRPARAGRKVVDRRRTRGLRRRVACRDVSREELVRRLRDRPGEFLEVQAVVYDPACPDIDEPCVIR